jgi:hypothetical protein
MATNKDKQRWISETQLFQRIAGVPVTSTEDLSAQWDVFARPRKQRELDRITTHRIIQDIARKPE